MNRSSQLHLQAEQAREKGQLDKSVALYKKALREYSHDQHHQRIHALCGMTNALLHLAEQETVPDVVDDHLMDALRAVAEADEIPCDDPLTKATLLTAEGKVDEAEGLLESAAEDYEQACDVLRDLSQDNPFIRGILLNNKIHQLSCLHRSGDDDYTQEMLECVRELEELELPDNEFEKKVWLSGALLHTSAAFKNPDPTRSEELLNQAKTLIESDSRLILRQKQLQAILN